MKMSVTETLWPIPNDPLETVMLGLLWYVPDAFTSVPFLRFTSSNSIGPGIGALLEFVIVKVWVELPQGAVIDEATDFDG